MKAAVVIARCPALPSRGIDQRAVVDQGCQRIPVGLFQRCQIGHRLDQRTGQPARIQCPVEPNGLGLAIPHQGQHLAGLGIGNDRCALQGSSARLTLLQLRQAIGHGVLGGCLDARIEGGEHPQALRYQIFGFVILAQLPLYQINKRRIGGATGGARRHVQRHLLGKGGVLGADQVLFDHHIQHQGATFAGAIRMAARIVQRRPLDHAHQQGDLVQVQILQRPAKVELAGQTKAVDRPAAILTKINGVAIRFENVILAIARVNQDRHQNLVDLALEGALIAQEQILDQLLGQGAAALHRAPGAQIGHHRPEDALGIDAGVLEKRTVLHRQ